MKKEIYLCIIFSLCLIGLIMACAGTKEQWLPPLQHPEEEGENLKYCMDCHDETDENIPYRIYVHTPMFMDNHRPVAIQGTKVCYMCHRTSFCGDCHGIRHELKPSIKNQTSTNRRMPHRGDYISRHRFDGRINPASCRRCHRNPKTLQTCKSCHG